MATRASHASAEILIIGGGVAGLSTAFHLGLRGATGVQLFEACAELGQAASAQNAGILRTLIHEPEICELARRSREFFERPPAGFSDSPLIDPVGLVATADRAEAAEELERCLAAHDRGFEPLDRSSLAQHAPHVRTAALLAAFLPHEGHVFPARLIAAFARGARSLGVELHLASPVERLLTRGNQVHGIRLSDGREVQARQVVLAAGAWGAQLARASGSNQQLTPKRRHVLVGPVDAAVNPRWPVVWNSGDAFYSKPADGSLWLCACDEALQDPGRDGRSPVEISAEELDRIRERSLRHLAPELIQPWWPAGGSPRDQRAWAGLRTFSEDERFVIGPDGTLDGLFWVGGLGGHGLVTAPAVGELAARALLGESPSELTWFGSPVKVAKPSL